jgi:hypothetical protein
MFNYKKLKDVLVEYKKDFLSIQWNNEKYKWEAVKHFQDHWDINAADFLEMFWQATEKTYNLLASRNYFPRRMIKFFAEHDPEAVRSMFISLFDESKDLVERYERFVADAEELKEKYIEDKGKQHYQHLNAISTYLWLRYPDKYYIYKYSVNHDVAKELESSIMPKRGRPKESLVAAYNLYNEICENLAEDNELKQMLQSVLTDDCYPDRELRTLTMDLGFYISTTYSKKTDNGDNNPRGSIQLALTQADSQELRVRVAKDMGNIIGSFSEIDKYIKDYTFDVSYDGDLEWDQRAYSIHGTYDLNGDGEADSINAVLIAGNEDGSYVEVNGIKMELNLYNPTGAANIIDLDSRDAYTEVAVFDDGASGDPAFTFIRYDGKKLFTVGTIDRHALMDGQGKFISWFHLANNFKPQFFSALGEFKNNEYVITNHDVEQYKGKTYEVDGTGFFVSLDNNPEDYFEHMVWDPETLREFKETRIKLLDIHMSPDNPTLNCFYVELPDGERGLLYFWIGD